MNPLIIDILPALRDNYIYVLRDGESRHVAVVDPSEPGPVVDFLKLHNLTLTHIFNTHHHPDHVGGNFILKAETNCLIVGPAPDKERIPGIDIALDDNDTYVFGDHPARVFFVPGHTRGHITFWFHQDRVLFCGDTLFACGCGRLFEGTPAQMWSSLRRLRDLPDDTRIYCGHEYTEANIRFALNLDSQNTTLVQRQERVRGLRQQGQPSLPALLLEEKMTNPFLRCDEAGFISKLGLNGLSPEQVFAEIRRRKDSF